MTDFFNTRDIAGGAGGPEDYILIRDEKADNTHAGTFTSGAWRTRDLTDIIHDTGSNATLSTNQITLLGGTYRFNSKAQGFNVGQHKLKLINITDTIEIIGTNENSQNTHFPSVSSFVNGRFTISGSKTFEVQHRCTVTHTTAGFGALTNYGVIEVYTFIEFWKEN